MNRFPVFIFALAAFSSVPIGAQQSGTSSQEHTLQATAVEQGSPSNIAYSETSQPPDPQQSTAAAVPVPSTANSPEISNPQLRPVTGELESKLDTRNAKAGDSVVLKTTEKASTAQGVVIPKGSKIVGHVTDVEAKGKSSENSRVTVQFDQAELKGGQSMPIKSVLQSVEPAQASASGAGDAYAGTAGGGPAAAGGTSAPSSSSNAGGVSGRSGPESSGPAASVTSNATTSSQPTGAPAEGTVVARNGNVAIRTTAIPGVLLANNADGQPFSNASGALLGAKRDVQLDTGTHVVVAIAEANTKNSR